MFRPLFGQVVDGSPDDIVLTPREQTTFDGMTTDNGQTHSWVLLRETVLVEHGFSPISEKGNLFSILLSSFIITPATLFSSLLCFLIVTELIKEATKPKDL